jgi:hypothetical protein
MVILAVAFITMRDSDEDDYEYEEDMMFSFGFLVDNPTFARAQHHSDGRRHCWCGV